MNEQLPRHVTNLMGWRYFGLGGFGKIRGGEFSQAAEFIDPQIASNFENVGSQVIDWF